VAKLVCNNCGAERRYDEEFDSYFCSICDCWLERVCGDTECEYCGERPEKPLDKTENNCVL
jgi:hypothetical protein